MEITTPLESPCGHKLWIPPPLSDSVVYLPSGSPLIDEPSNHFDGSQLTALVLPPKPLNVFPTEHWKGRNAPYRSVALNPPYLAFTLKSHPVIRVVDDHNFRCLLRGHSASVVDLTFVNGSDEFIASVGDDGKILVHQIQRGDSNLVARVRLQCECSGLSQIKAICGFMSYDVQGRLTASKNFLLLHADGNLFRLTPRRGEQDDGNEEKEELVEGTISGLMKCDECFDISADGLWLAASCDGVISTYLMPSTVPHHSWVPHAGQPVTQIFFAGKTGVLITTSRQNSWLRVWNIQDSFPHCIQSIGFGSGGESFLFHLAPSHGMFAVVSEKSSTVIIGTTEGSPPNEIRISAVTELQLEKPLQMDTHACIFVGPTEDNAALFRLVVRDSENMQTYELKSSYMIAHSTANVLSNKGEDILPDIYLGEKLQKVPQIMNLLTNARKNVKAESMGQKHTAVHKPWFGKTELISGHWPGENKASQADAVAHCSSRHEKESKDEVRSTLSSIDAILSRARRATRSLQQTTKNIGILHKDVSLITQNESARSAKRASFVRRLSTLVDNMPVLSTRSKYEKLPSLDTLTASSKKHISGTIISEVEIALHGISTHLGESVEGIFRKDVMSDSSLNRVLNTKQKAFSRLIGETFTSNVSMEGISSELDNILATCENKQNSSEIAIQDLISQGMLDVALGRALEIRDLELVRWILTTACPIDVWSDVVVDGKLSSENAMSLCLALCELLHRPNEVSADQTYESLLHLLRDALVSYKSNWAESVHAPVSKEIRGICLQRLESLASHSSDVVRHSYFRDACRILRN